LPIVKNKSAHVWHLFVVRTPNREDLQQYLHSNGVQTVIHYPIPPHKQEAYKEWGNFSYPISEKIHTEVLSLPLNNVLKSEEIEEIIRLLNAY
jgi:dTDP-4-amino-4,6-dideoxygalactose transaminase